jgi:type II secretory pathway component HofQ
METLQPSVAGYNGAMRIRRFLETGVIFLILMAVTASASEPLVNIDVVNGDVRDVYTSIAERAGYNIVLPPSVQGTITVKLVDVPWRKALEVVLQTMGHEAGIDVNTIYVAPMGKLR